MSTTAATPVPDPADLDRLINNIEYENQQYLKMIQKEEELSEGLRKEIQEVRTETGRLREETSHIDEDTRRYHRQYTQNLDTIDSLRKTGVLLREQEDALEQKLRQKQEQWQADKKEREAVLAKYEAIWRGYEAKYQSLPLYRQLVAKKAEVEAAQEKVRLAQERLDGAKVKLEEQRRHKQERENLEEFKDLNTFCIHIATQYVKAKEDQKLLKSLQAKAEKLEDQIQERRKLEEEARLQAEEERIRLAQEERRRQEEERRKLQEERRRIEEERKRVQEERRQEERRKLEEEKEEKRRREKERQEKENRKQQEEQRRWEKQRQEHEEETRMQQEGGTRQRPPTSRIPQPASYVPAGKGSLRSPATLRQPQLSEASPSRIPQRQSPPKLFVPTSPYIPKRSASMNGTPQKPSQLPIPKVLSPAPRPLVAPAASTGGQRSEVRDHTFSPPLPPDQAKTARKHRSPPKPVQQRTSPPKPLQQRHSPSKLMHQRISPPKVTQHYSTQDRSPLAPQRQAKRYSPPKAAQLQTPGAQVSKGVYPVVGAWKDSFEPRLAAMTINSPAANSNIEDSARETLEGEDPPPEAQQPETPGREVKGQGDGDSTSPTSNPKTPENQDTLELADVTSPFDYEKHLAKKNALFNKSPGFTFSSHAMPVGEGSPGAEQKESEPMQMDNNAFFQGFLGGGGDAGMMGGEGYSAKSLFGSKEPSEPKGASPGVFHFGPAGDAASPPGASPFLFGTTGSPSPPATSFLSMFGSKKGTEAKGASPGGFHFNPAGDATSPPGSSPFQFGPAGSPPTSNVMSIFGSGGGAKNASAAPGDGFSFNFGGNDDYDDVQSPKGFSLF